MENPLFPNRIERSAALGAFKRAGSTDLDVLASVKASLIQTSKTAVRGGWGLIISGVLVCLTILGIPAGIAMALMGWWVIGRAQKNIRLVDDVLVEFTAAPQPA
ncbi:hypothetical protein FM111_06110 [Brevundimonas diminuta 3F5N]|uniref:Uncharacterized protein n=1 Tax=Brevundimonas diminuta 3F5N TaxID=1255603 RepID=A0A1R4FPN5_BREDI|nr:hypothetical protein [Brevundimonas diminuta]SJM57777.1 hypothetical protein FM111_06110 [Brevundimonas diminuta 3F5N]